jgi:uncharacterized membrane protein
MTGKFSALRRPARPLHPPFTHFPIAGYVFAAAFDLASAVGSGHGWAAGLWHSGTFVVVGGLVICLVTMGTGFWDLVRFPPRSPAALRTTAVHVALMGLVFMVAAGDLAWRLRDYDRPGAPAGIVVLSLALATLACSGGWFGGKLVFGFGVGVAGQTGRDRDAAGQECAADSGASPGDSPG